MLFRPKSLIGAWWKDWTLINREEQKEDSGLSSGNPGGDERTTMRASSGQCEEMTERVTPRPCNAQQTFNSPGCTAGTLEHIGTFYLKHQQSDPQLLRLVNS